MRDRGAALSFTAYRKVDATGRVGDAAFEVPSTVSYRELLKTNVIACLTAVYDAEMLGKQYFVVDSRQRGEPLWLEIVRLSRHHEDYALWLSILRRINPKPNDMPNAVVGINEILAYYRVHDSSVSSNKVQAAAMQWAVYRKAERLSFWEAFYYFLHYAYRGHEKRKRW
jgi:hypothetical protein